MVVRYELQAMQVPWHALQDVVISPWFVSDHMPDAYEDAIESLLNGWIAFAARE